MLIATLSTAPCELFADATNSSDVADAANASVTEPMHRWLFDTKHVSGDQLQPVGGDLPGALQGKATFSRIGNAGYMTLDGATNSVLVAADATKVPLPKQDLTLEAWVRVDKVIEWGGIISALQDNGDFERGMLLGFRKNQFCLAVTSEKTKRLTYLMCKTPFETGKWYHVAGTYDGKEMRIYLNGKLENTSLAQQGNVLYPPKFVYTLGAYQDDNEHYRVTGRLHEVAVYDRAVSDQRIAELHAAKVKWFPKPAELLEGPFIQLLDKQSAKITYITDQPCPTVLEVGPKGGEARRVTGDSLATSHEIIINDLAPDTEQQLRVIIRSKGGAVSVSEMMKFDTSFFYELSARLDHKSPYANDATTAKAAKLAQDALNKVGVNKGYCLIVGCRDGRLAYEIATRSDMQVVVVEDDESNVARARQLLDQAGLYGIRVSVHQGDLKQLPYGPYFANLILSESYLTTGTMPGHAANLNEMLRPSGGVMMVKAEPQSADSVSVSYDFVRRAPLKNAGVWTHQYGEADNSSNSKDDLIQGPMEVLWWGKPGPRPMPDRGARNPAPLSVNGRLYVQGDRILFGLDAYNGTVLWSSQLPMMRRTNIPRDSSNMVAAADHLYVSVGPHVYAIDGQTGRHDRKFTVPPRNENDESRYDWGFLAATEKILVGSANRRRAGYKGDVGEWYEDFKRGQIDRVTSRHVFVTDRLTGKQRWLYDKAVVLNSTITIADGKIFFVESRNPEAMKRAGDRLVDEIKKDQHLVSLDLATGAKVWDKPVDLTKCEYMVYLSYAQHTLLVTGTDRNKTYHMYAFDAGGGSELWQRHDKAKKNHHSGQLQHPVHIKDKVYVNQHILTLREGKSLRSNIAERRGCGTMSASNNSLFYRHHFQGMWDLASDQRSEFKGIRSGCWLGIVPAGGVVLAPETSSGCSCTHAIQTSVAWVPIHRADGAKKTPGDSK